MAEDYSKKEAQLQQRLEKLKVLEEELKEKEKAVKAKEKRLKEKDKAKIVHSFLYTYDAALNCGQPTAVGSPRTPALKLLQQSIIP